MAANHILLQIISFSAFFLDGFAFAAEGLVGRAFGAGDSLQFMTAVRRTSVLAVLSAVVLASIVLLFGGHLIAVLTDLPAVRQAAANLTHLAAIYILLSVAAFQLDGIFIGASCTRQMRYGAIQSVLFFLLVCWILVPRFETQGLWWAMIVCRCQGRSAVSLLPANAEQTAVTERQGVMNKTVSENHPARPAVDKGQDVG